MKYSLSIILFTILVVSWAEGVPFLHRVAKDVKDNRTKEKWNGEKDWKDHEKEKHNEAGEKSEEMPEEVPTGEDSKSTDGLYFEEESKESTTEGLSPSKPGTAGGDDENKKVGDDGNDVGDDNGGDDYSKNGGDYSYGNDDGNGKGNDDENYDETDNGTDDGDDDGNDVENDNGEDNGNNDGADYSDESQEEYPTVTIGYDIEDYSNVDDEDFGSGSGSGDGEEEETNEYEGRCVIKLRSWGRDDNTDYSGEKCDIAINGKGLLESTLPPYAMEYTYRGINLVVIDTVTCTAGEHQQFDTFGSTYDTGRLREALTDLSEGSVVAGIACESADRSLGGAKHALKQMGINADKLQIRDKMVFVAEKGAPSKAYVRVMDAGGSPLERTIEIIDDEFVAEFDEGQDDGAYEPVAHGPNEGSIHYHFDYYQDGEDEEEVETTVVKPEGLEGYEILYVPQVTGETTAEDYCKVDLRSWGNNDYGLSDGDETVFNRVKIGDVDYVDTSAKYRGISLVSLDLCNCKGSDFKTFDTHGNAYHALKRYLSKIPAGTILLGVSGDEPKNHLSRAQLEDFGINLGYLEYRGKLIFILVKGEGALVTKTKGSYGSPLEYKAALHKGAACEKLARV